MQKAFKLTLCDGFSLSAASLASEPWKYWPAGILALRSGQLGTGAATLAEGAALATTGAGVLATDAAAVGFSGAGLFRRASAAAAARPSAATAATTKPSFDLFSTGRGSVVAAPPSVVLGPVRTGTVAGASSVGAVCGRTDGLSVRAALLVVPSARSNAAQNSAARA